MTASRHHAGNRKRILTRKLVHCQSEMRSFQSNCPLSPPNELTLMENVLSILEDFTEGDNCQFMVVSDN